MKHAIENFLGNSKDAEGRKFLVFETTCGLKVRFPDGSEIDEDQPVDDRRGGRPWCPECHPDRCVARLKDEDGGGVALHPELGELEEDKDTDGAVLAEDRGEEEVIAEEVDER